MRACLAGFLLLALGAGCALAAPFDPVPLERDVYRDCKFLAERGVIDTRPAGDFAGSQPLTRYDFALSLVRPMAGLETLAREGRVGAALDSISSMVPPERARVGATLARLLQEFGDVLASLGLDASQAMVGARLLENGDLAPTPTPRLDNAAGINYSGPRTRVGVTYRTTEGEAAALPPVPLGGFTDAPITGLAGSRLPVSRAQPDTSPPDRVALTDISLRRLRGTFEYGLTDELTLNLAYESLVREGRGTVALDAASLRTLGLGYRLSPSASVALKYHLIDYSDYTAAGARLEDRMAETELVVRF